MNNYWAFAPMTASEDLLGDATALRERLDEDGYLYLRGIVDSARIRDLRTQMLTILADNGWIAGGEDLRYGVAVASPVREGEDAFFEMYDEIQKLEAFHALAHADGLLSAVRQAVGETAFPHPLKVARLIFPGHPELSTPPHQDFPNNQGTPDLTAAWIPIGDCPMEKGTLAVLRGSHRFGVFPLEFHLGAGNRQAVVPDELRKRTNWVTNDMSAGDVLLFRALTVHASLHNATLGMRLSVDFRYQPEGVALTDRVLEPHFQRLTWDEIYAGWGSDALQYYWRDLDYRVVPYDRSAFEAAGPTDEDIVKVLAYEKFRAKRHRLRPGGD